MRWLNAGRRDSSSDAPAANSRLSHDSIAPAQAIEDNVTTGRINRAIEPLAQGQPIYYVGHHTGHVLSRAQGRDDAGTWADYPSR